MRPGREWERRENEDLSQASNLKVAAGGSHGITNKSVIGCRLRASAQEKTTSFRLPPPHKGYGPLSRGGSQAPARTAIDTSEVPMGCLDGSHAFTNTPPVERAAKIRALLGKKS